MHFSIKSSFHKKYDLLEIELRFNSRKIWIALEIAAIVFSLVSFCTQALVYLAGSGKAAWFIPLVDVDHEMSIPSIYSTLL